MRTFPAHPWYRPDCVCLQPRLWCTPSYACLRVIQSGRIPHSSTAVLHALSLTGSVFVNFVLMSVGNSELPSSPLVDCCTTCPSPVYLSFLCSLAVAHAFVSESVTVRSVERVSTVLVFLKFFTFIRCYTCSCERVSDCTLCWACQCQSLLVSHHRFPLVFDARTFPLVCAIGCLDVFLKPFLLTWYWSLSRGGSLGCALGTSWLS